MRQSYQQNMVSDIRSLPKDSRDEMGNRDVSRLPCFVGRIGACACSGYQALFPPPPREPGDEANHRCATILVCCAHLIGEAVIIVLTYIHMLYIYQDQVTMSNALKIIEEHHTRLVGCISKGLNSFVEEACNTGLLHCDVKSVILSIRADTNEKAKSLLVAIKENIEKQPISFHRLVTTLANVPQTDMNELASTLVKRHSESSVVIIVLGTSIPKNYKVLIIS